MGFDILTKSEPRFSLFIIHCSVKYYDYEFHDSEAAYGIVRFS